MRCYTCLWIDTDGRRYLLTPANLHRCVNAKCGKCGVLLLYVLLCLLPFACKVLIRAVVHGSRPPRNCCGPGCRENANGDVERGSLGVDHYDEKYFKWQARQGVKKARVTNWKRLFNISEDDAVLDYGAGTGAILSTLSSARDRVAVEVSDTARAYMRREYPKIRSYAYPEDVPDLSVDVIYSTSVLEHVVCPVQELRELRRKLRPGGRIIIGVKNEGVELWHPWNPHHKDRHLWTWNSRLIGNVLDLSGFIIERIDSQPGHNKRAMARHSPSEREINSMVRVLNRTHPSVDSHDCDKPPCGKAGMHQAILRGNFGLNGHVFQYLWVSARRKRLGEVFEFAQMRRAVRVGGRWVRTAENSWPAPSRMKQGP